MKSKINLLDLLLILTVVLSITGYTLAQAQKLPVNKLIQNKEKIAIEIFVPDIFTNNNDEIFKVKEKTALTIRNRPYTKLTILKIESKPKLITLTNNIGTYKTIVDPTKVNFKDYYITLTDTALKTSDAYVIGGNKIKIGNQVELEGFNYRVSGKVINVYSLGD